MCYFWHQFPILGKVTRPSRAPVKTNLKHRVLSDDNRGFVVWSVVACEPQQHDVSGSVRPVLQSLVPRCRRHPPASADAHPRKGIHVPVLEVVSRRQRPMSQRTRVRRHDRTQQQWVRQNAVGSVGRSVAVLQLPACGRRSPVAFLVGTYSRFFFCRSPRWWFCHVGCRVDAEMWKNQGIRRLYGKVREKATKLRGKSWHLFCRGFF